MSIANYFGDWKKVISYSKLMSIISLLDRQYAQKPITPDKDLVFKAFNVCPYNDLKVVFIGQDPYPQKDIATGILFGNNHNGTISPSLRVLKEAVIDYTKPHGIITFDNTLESWARQGILMINSALTVELNNPGSHTMMWRPFIITLLQNLSELNTGIIYVLFGKTAQTFAPYIGRLNYVLKYNHPAYAARMDQRFDCDAFIKINQILKRNTGTEIEWYQQY